MRRVSTIIIAIVLVLILLGIVMLASTSSIRGASSFNDPHYFLKRQLLWLAIALIVGLVSYRFDYHWWQKLSFPLAIVSVILLGIVIIPGLGLKVGGSMRWLRIGPLSVQPSELAKFSLVVVFASWMSHLGRRAEEFVHGLLFPICGLGVVVILLFLEPDSTLR